MVDDDSDSLAGYPDPSVGAIFATAQGWLYHHYGSYETEDTYKLCPLYTGDLVYGGGPPTLSDIVRDPMLPKAMDNVAVSIAVATNGVIDKVELNYRTNNGIFRAVNMTDDGEGTYTGELFEVSGGDWIEYFVQAWDTEGQTATLPADTSKKIVWFYCK